MLDGMCHFESMAFRELQQYVTDGESLQDFVKGRTQREAARDLMIDQSWVSRMLRRGTPVFVAQDSEGQYHLFEIKRVRNQLAA